MTTPRELSEWLKLKINSRDTLFDKSVNLFDIIKSDLETEGLSLRCEDKTLLIKLCKFLYENSFN
jgi:hypothetical protein